LGKHLNVSVWANGMKVASSDLAKGINRRSLKVLFDWKTYIFENICWKGFGGD